jgi:hypothetical protein
MTPTHPESDTEAILRAQRELAELDLSGEKAAAEALKREDAFKEQQLQEKAQQTKEFFAEQDKKQQESFQETQRQAEAQLAEKSQKEFWEAKQAQETQAAMDNELRGLNEAAKQEHQQFRAEFTQGICRDDAAAVVNGQIEERVGAYQERLSDLGSNAVDAAATLDSYKVKLESEASAEIESRTAELHQEHFPEYQGIAQNKPGLAPGEIPSSGFGPFEGGPQGGYGLEELVNKKGDSGPWEATAGPTPDKPFMRPMMDPRGDGTDAPEGWFKNVDELPKQDAPPGWFKNVDAPPADGKDIPDGFMKPIDPPIGEQLSAAMTAGASSAAAHASDFATFAKNTALNPEAIHLAAETLDHIKEWAVVPGIPHDLAGQIGQQFELMKEQGVEGLKAGVQITIDQAKGLVHDVQEGAQNLAENVSAKAQDLGDKVTASAQELGEKVSAKAQDLGQRVTASAEELAEKVSAKAQDLGEKVAASADALGEKVSASAQELAEKVSAKAQDLGDKVTASAQELGEKVKAGAQELKENFPISKGETLDRMAKADTKPETEHNKVQSEVHAQDVAAETAARNARMEEMIKQREADFHKTAEEITSAAATFAARAKTVDQQMQPPAPAQTPSVAPEVQPAAPAPAPVVATPATPAAPAAPAAPATPVVQPSTHSMNL